MGGSFIIFKLQSAARGGDYGGESLNTGSREEGRAAGAAQEESPQPPTAPLQALRGHNSRERLLCPAKQQLSYHLGGSGEGERAGGGSGGGGSSGGFYKMSI